MIDALRSLDAIATEADEAAQAGAFINRWQNLTASELSTVQSFARELCELLGVPAQPPHRIGRFGKARVT